jgi:hypothetical protein
VTRDSAAVFPFPTPLSSARGDCYSLSGFGLVVARRGREPYGWNSQRAGGRVVVWTARGLPSIGRVRWLSGQPRVRPGATSLRVISAVAPSERGRADGCHGAPCGRNGSSAQVAALHGDPVAEIFKPKREHVFTLPSQYKARSTSGVK